MIPLLAFVRSSKDDGIIIATVGAVTGVYLLYRGFRLLQRKRLILNTPVSKIRSASMGLVEMNGLAVGPYTMIAPITGVPCYYFQARAWQWQQRGRSRQWVVVADESLHVPFFLDDNTGRVLVDPQGAEIDIHRDFHDEFSPSLFSSSLGMPSNVSSFLARNGVCTDKKIKIDEYCIKPKNALFILGTLVQNPGLRLSASPVRSLTAQSHTVSFRIPGVSGRVSIRTGVTGTENMMLTAFKGEPALPGHVQLRDSSPAQTYDRTQQQKLTAALVKASITRPAAWAAAGLINPAVVVTTATTTTGAGAAATTALEQFDPCPPVVLMRGTHDPAFLISWHSQRDLVSSLSWKCTFMIWGGPALALLCAYAVAAHFNWL